MRSIAEKALLLISMAGLSAATEARAIISVSNPIYQINVRHQADGDIGAWNAVTGASHPAGSARDITYGGNDPQTSFSTLRVYKPGGSPVYYTIGGEGGGVDLDTFFLFERPTPAPPPGSPASVGWQTTWFIRSEGVEGQPGGDGGRRQIRWPRAKGDRPGRKAKGRSIWLGPAAVEVIQAIPRPAGCPWLIPGNSPATHLGSIDKAWARVCRIAGVEGTSPKSARHSFRSAGPEAGIASEHMRELVGHATSEMTDEVYWHANAEAQVRAAKAMDEHLGRLLQAPAPS